MRTKQSMFPRLVAVLLAVVLLVGTLPLGAMATDEGTTPPDTSGISTDPQDDASTDSKDNSSTDSKDNSSTDSQDDTSTDSQDDTSTDSTDDTSTDSKNDTTTDPQDDTATDSQDDTSTDSQDDTSTDSPDNSTADSQDDTSADSEEDTSADSKDDSSSDSKDDTSTVSTDGSSTDSTDDTSTNSKTDTSTDSQDNSSSDSQDDTSTDSTENTPPASDSEANGVDTTSLPSLLAVHACYRQVSLDLIGSSATSFTYQKADGRNSGTTIYGITYHYVDDVSNPAYCLEPDMAAPINLYVTEETTTVSSGNTGSRGSRVWNNNLSAAQREAIAMILLYGAPNNVWGTDTENQGYFAAGQVMVWEIAMGLRSPTFPYDYTSVSNATSLYNMFTHSATFVSGYSKILTDIQNSRKIPSFASASSASAPTITLKSAGSGNYTATVTDSNGILSKFNFTDPTGNVTFTKSGNTLTISARTLPGNTTFAGTRSVYSSSESTFDLFYPGDDSHQTMLTVDTPVSQTLSAYIKLEIEEVGRPFTLQKTADTSAACYAQIKDNPMYSLGGAKYQVSVNGTVTETLTTDANGRAASALEYDLGTVVTIKEVSAPPGYKLNSTAYTFTISESNTFTVSDKPVFDPPFAITKVDKTTTNPQGNSSFSGAVFKWEYFANTSWSGAATRTWYFTTNNDGYCFYSPSYLATGYTSNELYVNANGEYVIPIGTVKITEIKNSLGYTVLPESLFVSIVEDSTVESGANIVWTTNSWNHIVNIASGNYGVYEPIDTSLYGSFTLTKTDKDTGAMLAGATFQVINNSANSVKIGNFAEAEPGQVCYEFTTDENGQFSSGAIFPLGSYTIKEVSAPTHYLVNTDWTGSFTVTAGNNSFSFNCTNTGVGYAKLVKTTNTGNDLGGWGISLYYDEDCTQFQGNYVTDPDGTITTGELVHGTYYAKETSAPADMDTSWWIMDTSVQSVSISAGVTATVQFSNTHCGRIKGQKGLDTDGDLSGWQYKITDVATGLEIEGSPFTTDANGEIMTGNLLPGTYIVEELFEENSLFYCKSENPQTVTVVEGTVTEVNFTNALRPGRIEIEKVNFFGEHLAGAKILLEWSEDGINWFPVTYSDKPDVVKGGCTTEGLTDGWLITDASGIIAFEGLYPTLQYRVTELDAPEGYIPLADYAFVDVLPVDDLEVVLTVFNSTGFILPSTGVEDNTFFLISIGAFLTTFSMAIGLMVVWYNVSNGPHALRRKNNHTPKHSRTDK